MERSPVSNQSVGRQFAAGRVEPGEVLAAVTALDRAALEERGLAQHGRGPAQREQAPYEREQVVGSRSVSDQSIHEISLSWT